MSTEQVCSEEQAIALAGVSARTLQRFCESGYLTRTTATNGEVSYLRSQLVEIFGCSDASDVSGGDRDWQEMPPPVSQVESNCALNDYSAEECGVAATCSAPTDSSSTLSDIDSSATAAGNDSPKTVGEPSEIERLRNLLAIQERMLDAKDDEIADLKNQRAWLRQRIEKQEEKSDRDQILLLSETQTIRTILAYKESRKSPFRQVLEWIGITQPTSLTALPQSSSQAMPNSGTGRTIEVRQASNAE